MKDGAPEGIRIPDRRYRKPVLYPAELRTHLFKENEIIADKAYNYLSWLIFRTNSTSAFERRSSLAIASISIP